MAIPNREITRFVEYVGGNTKAAEILDCSPDMVRKLKTGLRGFRPEHVRAMYLHKGFRLSFLRLFDLDWRPKT
jgi:DNA-binding transcriptional regulator YdaS (Cro superfamily)